MDALTVEQTKEMLLDVAVEIQSRKEELGEIDRQIGDGDHGVGMSIGFAEIEKILLKNQYTNVEQVFKDCGMAMIRSMGGASGVLFGTLFLGISKQLANETELDIQHLSKGLREASKDIENRGGASAGDKTMLDALIPAADALEEAAKSCKDVGTGMKKAADAAAAGVENTKKYVARFGRAKSLGKRTIGHQDPGATTISYIFRAMAAFCGKEGA
ncbi:dihydroxyacetone kinase subunit DhaL [Heyndrickxia acidiproducens]|uniref:dihydroxyacetone kinase subunit DhaL n=1 Tax=Heyndrickxia acidiproducens TaxID=1121084 RepID=UPI000373FB6E|nr:dihydroxyacetone kinase subunit DhaL [Heyndrickxia acidiproducens]